jgi:hypothetical protein
MNFVGHAFIASRSSDDPVFALGAMLPDFASMIGARLGKHDHAVLAAGIADHHHTDDAFHGAPTFVRLCRDEAIGLEAIGLSWGASRAVAHVATELALDGLLLEQAPIERTYLDAIDAIEWTLPALRFETRGFEHDGIARFRELHARLSRYGPPHGYRDPIFVRDRMVQILARRPRLALLEGDADRLGDYLPAMCARVREAAPSLLAELDRGLGASL